MKKNWSRFALAGAMTLTISGVAFAGPFVDQVPTQVEFGETQLLQIQANNIIYQAQPASPGCGFSAPGVETLKVWTNLSQAALLSGKTTRIYFDVCNNKNWIRDIVLKQ